MELTHDDVLQILDVLEGSDVEYLELEVDGTRVVADRSGTGTHHAPSPAPTPAPEPSMVDAGEEGTAAPAVATSTDAPDLVNVTAPMVGVFYRSPEPGAAPFVEVGDQVDDGATVGLVEVMKMFNSVTAPAVGEVVEFLVENEAFVEYEQPLMMLRPEPTG